MRDQFFRVTEIQGDEIHCEGGLIGNADHGPRSMSRCFHRNRIVRVLPPKEAAKISRRMGRAAPAEEKASAGSS